MCEASTHTAVCPTVGVPMRSTSPVPGPDGPAGPIGPIAPGRALAGELCNDHAPSRSISPSGGNAGATTDAAVATRAVALCGLPGDCAAKPPAHGCNATKDAGAALRVNDFGVVAGSRSYGRMSGVSDRGEIPHADNATGATDTKATSGPTRPAGRRA